jgi:hypothetical protein
MHTSAQKYNLFWYYTKKLKLIWHFANLIVTLHPLIKKSIKYGNGKYPHVDIDQTKGDIHKENTSD